MNAISGFSGLRLPELSLRAGGDKLQAATTLPDEDPCLERVFADIPAADAHDVDQIVQGAKRALVDPAWRDLAPAARARLLNRLADAVEADSKRLAALESLDTGKPLAIAEAVDIPAVVAWFRYYAGWADKLQGDAGGLLGMSGGFHAYTRREPIGVVAAICPWNFPLVLAVWKIAPALAAGCTVVLKPAPETPLSSLRLAEILIETGFPAGVLSVATGGVQVGEALVAHPDIAKVAFTGSTRAGQAIMASASAGLKPVTLELGGKSPVIVCKDADLERAVPQIAASAFFNAGQVCYAGTRLLVHHSLYEEVVSRVAVAGAAMQMGAASDPASQLGPLISGRQRMRVEGFVDRALHAGIRRVETQTTLPEHGYFFAPTVLRDVPLDAEIMREEVFGPVLSTASFDDLDTAVAAANDSEYGLAAHVFTTDLKTAHETAARLEAGTVFVNCALLADPGFPFGGRKRSGIGRENGREAIEAYLETKSVITAL